MVIQQHTHNENEIANGTKKKRIVFCSIHGKGCGLLAYALALSDLAWALQGGQVTSKHRPCFEPNSNDRSTQTTPNSTTELDFKSRNPILEYSLMRPGTFRFCSSTSAPVSYLKPPKDPIKYLKSFVNYEAKGVPRHSGLKGDAAFPLYRMWKLLSALGEPNRKLRVVHVAGTKGKGSVCHLIASILASSGLKVGLYTSPHVECLTERICVSEGGEMRQISMEELKDLVDDNRDQIEGLEDEPTFFEVLTGLALKKFADSSVQIAVVEVGMGGLTDATNIFHPKNLAMSIITPIGLEHTEALGDSVEKIAKAKAGIMKQGIPVIASMQTDMGVTNVLREEAFETRCDLNEDDGSVVVQGLGIHTEFGNVHEKIQICLKGVMGEELISDVHMKLMGSHQHGNICTAIRSILLLKSQGWDIQDDAIKKGLEAVQLPGRFQILQEEQFVVLDGAHTKESAHSFVRNTRQAFPNAPVALILSMAEGKNFKEVMGELIELKPDVVLFTTVQIWGSYNRTAAPGTLLAHWDHAESEFRIRSITGTPLRSRKMVQASLPAAFERAKREIIDKEGIICVTGSMYAVAEALQNLKDLQNLSDQEPQA